MEDSILISTKKILNIDESYNAFDLDILTHMNMVFSTLNQIGVGPTIPVMVEDNTAVWSELDFPPEQLAMIKTYVFLKVRLLFDPPGTSFVIEAMNKQISELEWRLNFFREVAIDGI
jgi:hypothetical protein